MKLQLEFEYQGRKRVLNKHPRVQAALDAEPPTMTEAAARLQPWYLRAKIPPADMKPYKLSHKDADAIRAAKDLLKSANTDDFKAFVEARESKIGVTLAELWKEWQDAGLPFSKTEKRNALEASELQERIVRAIAWPGWSKTAARAITTSVHDDFAEWRIANTKRGADGRRSVDIELSALSSMCQWAVRVRKLEVNPFEKRTRYQKAADVQHCHFFMPHSDEEFHRVLSWFWTTQYTQQNTRRPDRNVRIVERVTRVSGAWLAFCGLTGLRPEEPGYLYLHPRRTEPPGVPKELPPGTIFPTRDGGWKMRVVRTKGGQNPFVQLTPAALDFLNAWEQWLADNFPKVEAPGVLPWFPHPSPQDDKGTIGPLCPPPDPKTKKESDTTILNKRLDLACAAMKIDRRLKPKGMGRAFYVRVRRSQGLDDAEIAGELGQTTNGKLIRDTYGDPDDLRGGALFDWQAEDDKKKLLPYSWRVLVEKAQAPANVIRL